MKQVLRMSLRSRIRERAALKLHLPEIPSALAHLEKRGFQPKLIFDVGAYQGDFARLCRRHWPSATIACFEPLKHKVKEIEALASQDQGIVVFDCLLGAQQASNVALHESETASSVLSEHIDQKFPVQHHEMFTVDQIVDEQFAGRAPDFLKLDVQGYELEVLKGAERSLTGVQALLAEVNLIDIHEGVPLIAEFVQWLDGRGFVAYDICGLTRRPLDGALWQIDMIFVPEHSGLRNDKRYA
jgi:FkbM family methyltransferase